MRSTLFAVCLFVSFSIVGCGGTASSSNNGGGGTGGGGGTDQAVVQLSPTALDFGTVGVGATSTSQTITLTNTGDIPLTLSNFAVDDADAGFFPIGSGGNCAPGGRVSGGASCTVVVSFKPTPAQDYNGTLTFSDDATNSPQTVTLKGTGDSHVPTATLSTNSVYFGSVTVNTTTAASTVTLSNTGGVPLTITSIALGGPNPSSFAETNTCGASIAAAANCTISVTFTPTAGSLYSAAVTVTDNSSTGTTQTISLNGSGASTGGGGSSTNKLYVIPEADNTVTPLYALVNNATSTVDITMYALNDTTFKNDLVAACGRGVKVRAVLDQNNEKSQNTAAYTALNAATNCSAVWANKAFQVTHQKTLIIDGNTVAIMSLNLQSQYYKTTRDFAYIETDANDIAGIQATFNADYAAGTTSSGTVGTSDYSYTPPTGDNLIWSPTTAKTEMTNIIANAKKTIILENEEMATSASYIVNALKTACQSGVTVQIAMVDQSSWESNFTALEAAGCGVHVYPDTSSGFYIHAKAVVADYGLPTQKVYMGSINYSNASMTQNRELGVYITDQPSIDLLNSTMVADYAGGKAY